MFILPEKSSFAPEMLLPRGSGQLSDMALTGADTPAEEVSRRRQSSIVKSTKRVPGSTSNSYCSRRTEKLPPWQARNNWSSSMSPGGDGNALNLIMGSVFIPLLILVQVISAMFSQSLAALSVNIYLLMDYGAFMIIALSLAARGSPEYRRQCFIIGSFSSLVLIVGGLWIFGSIATSRLTIDDTEMNPVVMMAVACASILISYFKRFRLSCICSSEASWKITATRATGTDPPAFASARAGQIEIQSAMFFGFSGCIQWTLVFIAMAIAYVWPKYSVVDPMCAMILATPILAMAVTICSESVRVLFGGEIRSLELGEESDLLEKTSRLKCRYKLDISASHNMMRYEDHGHNTYDNNNENTGESFERVTHGSEIVLYVEEWN